MLCNICAVVVCVAENRTRDYKDTMKQSGTQGKNNKSSSTLKIAASSLVHNVAEMTDNQRFLLISPLIHV